VTYEAALPFAPAMGAAGTADAVIGVSNGNRLMRIAPDMFFIFLFFWLLVENLRRSLAIPGERRGGL
jgi:hypothetical protein